MAKTTRPLNDTQIKQARSKEKEYVLADGKGLLLRVKPSGSKLWLFNYTRIHTKKRANLSLGPYPDLSLSKAREKAQALRELLVQGITQKSIELNRAGKRL